MQHVLSWQNAATGNSDKIPTQLAEIRLLHCAAFILRNESGCKVSAAQKAFLETPKYCSLFSCDVSISSQILMNMAS